MNKYWSFFLIQLQNILVYRASFFLSRFRQLLSFFVSFFVWQTVFHQTHSLYHYTLASMMTYVFLSLVLRAFVFNSNTYELASTINNGDLSLYLMKPLSLFKTYFSLDLANKLIDGFFLLFELPFLYLLFRPPLIWPANLLHLFQFLIYVLVAILSFFYLSFMLGSLGFWTRETWAPRFLLMVILEFAVGGIFPLDMLPSQFHLLISLSPFSHLLFFPLQTYLGFNQHFLFNFSLALFWLFFFYLFAHFVWLKGLKHYEAEGR